MGTFNPLRLTIARKRRRLSSKALADLIGSSPVTISRLENGYNEPEDQTLDALAKALEFPRAFFTGGYCDELKTEAASFRSLTAMSARERDAALSAGALAYLFSDWVAQRFNLPKPALPDSSFEANPEAAAHAVRQQWGLGQQPVSDMVKLLESKGVRVFSLSENTKNVDAFSCWRDSTPYVFLNTFKSTEHSRFDAAHELGHLLLHKHGGPHQGHGDPDKGDGGTHNTREAETEANRFASCFLMPTEDVASRVRGVTALDDLVKAKKRWGVSVAALAYRLNKMGRLTEWQYRGFCIEMNRRGYRTQEPDTLPPERSVVWQKVLSALWNERLTKEHIAAELNLPAAELENLLFGLTGAPDLVSRQDKPALRLVKM